MKCILIKILLALLLLVHANIGVAIDSLPCWLNNPVTESQTGFIGAANPFSSSVNGSLIASRKRALTSLSQYYGFNVNINALDVNEKRVLLANGKQILFSTPYINNQALYSYATIEHNSAAIVEQQQWLAQQCPQQSCDFKQCQPLWLCSDNITTMGTQNKPSVGVIHGVSQMTANPAKQLATTKNNAQELLKYIFKSDVKDHSYQVKSTGKYQNWGCSQHSGSVIGLGNTINLLNTHSCQTSNYLFARYTYPTVSLSDGKFKSYPEWLKAPNIGKQTGIVGAFDGIVADGRFSSAIKLAIKDGLIELAKTKKITIDHNYQLKYHQGSYSLAKTTMDTEAMVSAQLQDIKIIEKNNKLVVYAWLLESEVR
ncbi:MAG: hypothetical protein JKY81_11920 [Colwellia sp.]|nr:hypothetical protein [Colwellia sp.]